MLETLEATKHETLKLINDVVYFENLFLIRSTDKLTAISSDSHKTVWEIELKGETLINLYKIYTVNNVIITFSYFREEDLYGIHGIDSSGKLLWSSSVTHQPNGVHAVCVKNDKLIYNGYSSSSTDTLILEVDPVNGSVSPILSLETSASNLCNINENIILSGSSGIYIMEEKSNSLKQISDDFIVNILSSSDREMKYISQSGEKGIYNVVVLDENLTTTIMGNVNLDSSNKGNMTPTLNGGNMISFKGRNKGVAYTDLTNGNVIWHIGDGEITRYFSTNFR